MTVRLWKIFKRIVLLPHLNQRRINLKRKRRNSSKLGILQTLFVEWLKLYLPHVNIFTERQNGGTTSTYHKPVDNQNQFLSNNEIDQYIWPLINKLSCLTNSSLADEASQNYDLPRMSNVVGTNPDRCSVIILLKSLDPVYIVHPGTKPNRELNHVEQWKSGDPISSPGMSCLASHSQHNPNCIV